MRRQTYDKTVNMTLAVYIFLTCYDFLTSMVCMGLGYVEMNPLYGVLGIHYWTFYIIASTVFPFAVIELGGRWHFLALWMPSITHAVATINNQMLILGAV